MKIILATPLYPPDIAEPAPYVKELASRLCDKHDVTIVAYSSIPEEIPGVKIMAVSKRQPLLIRLVKYTYTLFKTSRGADIIYVQNGPSVDLSSIIVGHLRGIPVIIRFTEDKSWERAIQLGLTAKRHEQFLNEPDGNLRISFMMMLQIFALRRARFVTAPSNYFTKIIRDAYKIKNGRVIVLYNPPEKKQLLPFEASFVPYQIMTEGTLMNTKNVDGIIRAVASLKEDFPAISLLIAGIGPEEVRLKTLAQTLGVADSVVFLGNISRAESWYIHKSAHVYIQNSIYEDTPYYVIKAFSAGIPLIATSIPPTVEAVLNEQSGLLIKPENDKSLSDAISRLFKDKELSQRLVDGGQRVLSEKFSWSAHVHNLLTVFESIKNDPVRGLGNH